MLVNKNVLQTSHAATLIKLAVPMIISQGAMALMIFTDRYFMSHISPLHMTASLGGGVTSFFTLSLFIGLISYGNAMVAQYYGAKAFRKCAKVITAAFVIILCSLPLLAIITYLSPFLFVWMDHPQEQISLETVYFYTLQVGAIFTLIKIAFASFFVGIGKTKTVMIADSLAVIINIPLSYVLIFGFWHIPAMGIVGAGIGTLLSTLLITGLYAGIYFNRTHQQAFDTLKAFFVIDSGILRRYIPIAIEST